MELINALAGWFGLILSALIWIKGVLDSQTKLAMSDATLFSYKLKKHEPEDFFCYLRLTIQNLSSKPVAIASISWVDQLKKEHPAAREKALILGYSIGGGKASAFSTPVPINLQANEAGDIKLYFRCKEADLLPMGLPKPMELEHPATHGLGNVSEFPQQASQHKISFHLRVSQCNKRARLFPLQADYGAPFDEAKRIYEKAKIEYMYNGLSV